MACPSSFQFDFAKYETPGICGSGQDLPTANSVATEKESKAKRGLTKVLRLESGSVWTREFHLMTPI